jgi:hypothetical protein
MGDPQQVVWDDEQKAAPAAGKSSVQWDDAGNKPAATATSSPTQAAAPASIAPPSGSDWLAHPFKSAGQSIDIASQYYGAKGDKNESIAKGVGKSLGRTATMIPATIAHPYDALVGGNLELKQRAEQEAAQGKGWESGLHSIAAGIPIAGPLAISIGDRLGGTSTQAPSKSDIAGGLTDIATILAAPKIGEAVKEGAAPGGVLRRSATAPTTPVGEGAPALPTVKGVVDAAANTTPGRQAIAAGKYVGPALKGFASDLPGVKGAVKAVENVKAAKASIAESDARASDYKMAADQSELARTGGKDVPSYRDVNVSTEGRPAGFPDRLTEKTTPGGKTQILGPKGEPFIGERSTRVTDAEIANNAAKRGLSVDEYKQQLRQPKPTPNIAEPETPAKTPAKVNIAEYQAPEFQEIKSGVKQVGRAGESKAAQASYGDAEHHSIGQFAKVNGPRIDAAIPNTPEGQTLANHLHDIKGPELKQVTKDLKVDISDIGNKGKKGTTVNREAVFNRLLDAGHSPETIVDTHLQRFGNPAPVSGGSGALDISRNITEPGQVKQRLADPNVRAENRIGNDMMADKYNTGTRLPDRITALNDLAKQAKDASPEELQELDRQGQNLYSDTKTNIAKAYSKESPASAKPNIAETPAQGVKVWRDAPGEAHPVKIVYDEHGIPTAETDGRHRVIQALKNGYDRIEVTVDRGHGPQKTTVPVRALARQMGVDETSLANTDSQQSYRAGNLKPRIAVTKQ